MAKEPVRALAVRRPPSKLIPSKPQKVESKRSAPAVYIYGSHKPWHCDQCEEKYRYRNYAEWWALRNGMVVKVKMWVCQKCVTPAQAQRFMMNIHLPLPQFKIVPKPIVSR